MKKILFRIFAIVFFPFCVIILFLVLFDKSYTYQLELYSTREAINTFNREINAVIIDEINNTQVSYDNIIIVEKDDKGKISCVKSNMLLVNKLKDRLNLRISEILKSGKSFEADIPVGNLLGGSLLYGKGFNLKVKFKPIGDVYCNMTGDLKECGINQAIYRVSFDVYVNVAIVFPFRYIEVPIRYQTVVAETVIVGDVPQSFTYFTMDGDYSADEIQGYIEDFKAE